MYKLGRCKTNLKRTRLSHFKKETDMAECLLRKKGKQVDEEIKNHIIEKDGKNTYLIWKNKNQEDTLWVCKYF